MWFYDLDLHAILVMAVDPHAVFVMALGLHVILVMALNLDLCVWSVYWACLGLLQTFLHTQSPAQSHPLGQYLLVLTMARKYLSLYV